MKGYLFSLTAAALLSALVLALVPEGSVRRTVQLGCGLLLALTALSPLLKLDYDAIAKQIAEIQLDTETARTGVEVQNRELQARIISEQAAAYIWDKADEMGVALEVEVETRDLGSGPYPWRATLTGTCGGEKRTALTQYIEENLAIPEARQVWQCEYTGRRLGVQAGRCGHLRQSIGLRFWRRCWGCCFCCGRLEAGAKL